MTRTVFYHVSEMGHWAAVVAEQLRIIKAADFADELMTVYCGGPDGLVYLRRLGEIHGIRLNILEHYPNGNDFEFPTFRHMQKALRAGLDGIVYYLHTKGVSAPACWIRMQWRWLMNAGMLRLPVECDRLLDRFDWIGPVIYDDVRFCHSSGNYFGARADYLRTLPDIGEYRSTFVQEYAGILPFGCGERHAAEMWIGTKSQQCASPIASLVVPGWGVADYSWWMNRVDVQEFCVRNGA